MTTPADAAPPRPGELAGDPFRAPALRARQVYLRAVAPADYSYLQMLETNSELLFRWRLRGATPSPEAWAQTMWAQVLAQFLVIAEKGDKPVGLVTLYRPNFQDGYAYLSAARFEQTTRSPLMMLGISLFIQYVFACWDFRKLYMEVPEFNLDQLASGVERGYFAIEGRLRKHFFFDGRFWDQTTLALYREAWEQRGGRLRLERGKRTDFGADQGQRVPADSTTRGANGG